MGKRSVTIDELRKVVEGAFPDYWPAVEAGLATIGTLLLKDNANPATLFYLGPPSSGKTTVVEMFSGHPITYRSDKFTPASFVSQMANRQEDHLRRIDLLPRIKYKCFLTPEMAPNFSGADDIVRERLSTMTRVLDGRGLVCDSGAHGGRGYTGDYLFSWIGATTPFRKRVWEIMGSMGSRMFFWPMTGKDLTEQELIESQRNTSYKDRLEASTKAVHSFLDGLFGEKPLESIRSISWESDPDDVLFWIARLSKLLTALRTDAEAEFRAMAVLTNFARGLALIHGRKELLKEDLCRTSQLAVGSIPDQIRKGLTTLIRAGGWARTRTMALGVGCSFPTAQDIMKACDGKVMEYVENRVVAGRTTSYLCIRDEWAWTEPLIDVLGGPITVEPDILCRPRSSPPD